MTSKARNIADLGSNDVIETTATGVDVTGTVTADGLTVETAAGTSGTIGLLRNSSSALAGNSAYLDFKFDNTFSGNNVDVQIGAIKTNAGNEESAFVIKTTEGTGTPTERFRVEANGDASFYEDTGTTAKMVWDASAESLGIGRANPRASLDFGVPTLSSTLSTTLSDYQVMLEAPSGTGNYAHNIGWSESTGSAVTVASINAVDDGSSSATGITFATGDNSSITERMRIDSSGNVGIGTASPSGNAKLDIVTSNDSRIYVRTTNVNNTITSNGTGGLIGTYTAHPLVLQTNGTERARINSSGQLLVNTTTGVATTGISDAQIETVAKANKNAIATQMVTSGYAAFASSGITSAGGDYHFYGYMVNSSNSNVGSIRVNHNGVVYNTTSDQRLKENIQDTTHTVDINDIQVRQFDWKDGGNHERYGFIAQELETVYPEAVTRPDNDDEMMSVDYSKLVPLLVKEIQQLKAEIKELKA